MTALQGMVPNLKGYGVKDSVKPSKPPKLKPGDTVAAWYIDGCRRRHDFKSATVVKYEREHGGWRLDVGGLTVVLPEAQIELCKS